MQKVRMMIFAVTMLVAIGWTAGAQEPTVRVIADRGSSVTVEFTLNGYDIQPENVNGAIYSRILLPGAVSLLEKGMPELPTVCRNVIVADEGVMDIRIVEAVYETRSVDPVIPSKGNLYRNVDPATVPYEFSRFYEGNIKWPAQNAELSEPFILRDYRGVSLRVNPFQYQPATRELTVLKRLVVEIYRAAAGGVNTLKGPRDGVTREFAATYETVFLNFHSARYDSLTERAGRLLIITADAYLSNMQSFKVWKRQKGIRTKMVTLTQIGGNSVTNIKNAIQAEYNAGSLVWVLLVGDGNELAPATGTVGSANGASADPTYGYLAGGDYYPDAIIARFSSNGGQAANIDKQVSRSINYEKTPMTSTTEWYHSGLGIASNQTGGSPAYADSTRMNFLRDSLRTPKYYYTHIDSSYDSWGTATMIKNFIETGVSIINYIGHGSQTSWVNGGGFSITDINNLNNPWKLPFVISVACVVGDFASAQCFCEASLTAGDVSNPDGFLGHWGSSINQSWEPPCWGQAGAVGLLTHNMKNTFGAYCFNGAAYMIEHYGATAVEGVEMAQTWHIFGDPTVQVRTNVPVAMTVNHAGAVNVGQTTFNVSVPGVPNALVGLYVDTLLLGNGYTDGSGNVTVTMSPPPGVPGTMYVTVTAYNKIPYLGSVPIVSPSGPYIVTGAMLVNDFGNSQINPGDSVALNVYAKNVGSSAAQGVFGKLTTGNAYVTITRDSSWYGNIAVNESIVGSPAYRFRVANNAPNGNVIGFTLRYHDYRDSIWTAYPSLTIYAPVLVYVSVSVVGGNGNGILDPGETANLVATIRNDGGADAPSVTSTLMENSAYLTIGDASGSYGTVNVGASASNASDPYTVTAAAGTPIGTTVPLQIQVVSGVYCDTLDFSLVIGKKHYYLWNPDPTPTPGQNMNATLTALGYTGDYGTTLAADLSYYQAVLVCVGIYANNYVISSGSAEATRLVDYLQNQSGRVYLEGGDVWYYDPGNGGYNFCSLFGINATADGTGDVGPVVGQAGTFTNGMNFTGYTGENSYIDHISASGTGAFLIFRDGNNAYDCGVARSVAGSYRTVGNSFELGLLTDASGVTTRAALIDSIMKFFGCQVQTCAEENLNRFLAGRSLVVFPTVTRGRLNIAYNAGLGAEGVGLKVYDISGRLVNDLSSLVSRPSSVVTWKGDDDLGRQVASGVYFVKFTQNGSEKVEKAVLLR